MIQELFGGGATGLLNRDRNLPISAVFEPSPSPSPSSSTTTNNNNNNNNTTNAATITPTNTPEIQKLRCPRCDSSNTKFCYYNNYNLTQPRHFCKTCRRYWTKGGALRNVPIGGGCRKNKGNSITTTVGKPLSSNGKLKAVVSSELLGRSSNFLNNTFDHEFNPNNNPILWSSSCHPPQTSHLLSLLRASQNPNPNFPKIQDHQGFMVGSNLGLFEPSSLGSLWRNNNQQLAQQTNNHQQQQQISNIMTSDPHEVENTENNPYHQRIRSNYYDQSAPLVLGGNVVNTSSSTNNTSTILDSAPVLASGELGFWNQTLPWSDLPAANGAYP